MGEPVDPMAQLHADSGDWEEWAAARIDGQPVPPPGPLPAPWVAHPTEARISATWDCYSAEVVADPERVRWTDAWRWSVSVDNADGDRTVTDRLGRPVVDFGVADWIDDALAAAVDALPVGVAG